MSVSSDSHSPFPVLPTRSDSARPLSTHSASGQDSSPSFRFCLIDLILSVRFSPYQILSRGCGFCLRMPEREFSPKSAFSGAARPQFPEGWGPRRSSLPERPRGAVCRPRPRRPPSPDPAAATCPPPRPLASHPSPQAAGRHCSLGAQPRSRQQRRAAPSSSRLPSAMSTLPKSPPWCSAIEMRHFLSASSPALSLPLRCCGSPPAPPTSPPPSPPREHGARTELSRWFGRTGCKMRRGALEGGDRFPAR